MVKSRNVAPHSFSNVKYFPGCSGNPFDLLLHSIEGFEKISPWALVFLLMLLAMAGSIPALLASVTNFWWSGCLLGFFLLDWLLMALLPVTKTSYGPVKIITLLLACLRVPFAWLPLGWNLGFELAGTLLVVYGFYVEPFLVTVHHETLAPRQDFANQVLRFVHLGDLHIERITRRERAILRKVKLLSPDLILFSGDVLNLSYIHDEHAQADALWFFSQLDAPQGVYGVTGSPAVDFPDFFKRLADQTPLKWLDNEVVLLDSPGGTLNVIGLTCTHNPDLDEKTLCGLLPKIEGTNILLYHSPDLAPNASRYPIDLQCSGHTHGGQVRLPIFGALYSGSLYGKLFESGRYNVNGMPLYVTRGLGLEGAVAPRVRFLCPPEIIVWDLKSE